VDSRSGLEGRDGMETSTSTTFGPAEPGIAPGPEIMIMIPERMIVCCVQPRMKRSSLGFLDDGN